LSHTIPPVEELKWRVYCKWHGSFLHNTNDCDVFHWQIQSATNECWLRPPIPISTLEPTSKKVLVRPCVADKSEDKNIVIGDLRMPNMLAEWLLGRLRTKERPEALGGGKHDRTPNHGHLLCISRTVRALRPNIMGQARAVWL
jgi:hypothetical protein